MHSQPRPKRLKPIWVVAGLAVAWLPSQGHAARVAVVVAGTGSGADKAAALVDHHITVHIEQNTAYELVDIAYALGGSERRRSPAVLAAAEKLVDKARAAYDAFELESAIDALNKAIARYERLAMHVDTPADIDRVTRAYLLLGATHILMGNQARGDRWLSKAVALDRGIKPDPTVFNPNMREMFRRAAAAVAAQPLGQLTLGSNPSYARAYVDGRFVGVTPTVVGGLSEGKHFVRMVKDGYRAWGSACKVLSGRDLNKNATLRPIDQNDEFHRLREAAMEAMRSVVEARHVPQEVVAIAQRLGVRQVLLGAVTLEGERIVVQTGQYDLDAGRRIFHAQQVFKSSADASSYAQEVNSLMRRHFESSASVSGGSREPLQGLSEIPSAEDSVLSAQAQCGSVACDTVKVIILACGGVLGLAAAGVGGTMWFLTQKDYEAYHQKPRTSVEAQELRRSGETKALVGDLLVPVGGALAIASVATFLFWDPQPSPEDALAFTWQGLAAVPQTGGAALMTRMSF